MQSLPPESTPFQPSLSTHSTSGVPPFLPLSRPLPLTWSSEQICALLRPQDLISLAKTSKTLHRIFVTDDSSSLWSVARRTVGMPDLEAEMSEVKYALLLWGSACQVRFFLLFSFFRGRSDRSRRADLPIDEEDDRVRPPRSCQSL